MIQHYSLEIVVHVRRFIQQSKQFCQLLICFPQISDEIRHNLWPNSVPAYAQMMSLQYALYTTAFVSVLGGGAFLAAALYIQNDKARVSKIVESKFYPLLLILYRQSFSMILYLMFVQ